ncbi:MAG: hypothetical protein AB8G95_31060 [Anaerolineae bacterium]
MNTNRVLQVLIGNRETMMKGFAAGTGTTLIIAILYIFLVGSASGLLTIILAVFLGHAFGWLFIRPIAQIIEFKQPDLTDEMKWRKSSLIAWLPIALIIFFPQTDDLIFFEKLIVVAFTFLGVCIASVAGGYRVTRVRLNVYYKEWKAFGLVGGKATGLLLAIVWLVSGFPAIQMQFDDGLQATLANSLSTILIFSVLATFPAHLIFGIGKLFGKNSDLDEKWQLPYSITGIVIWSGLAILLFVFPSSSIEKNFLNYLLIPIVGMCGGLGGWVMGYYYKNQHSEKTAEFILK